jgi:ABC-type transport system involved in cytochrome c biogenesis permease subunit
MAIELDAPTVNDNRPALHPLPSGPSPWQILAHILEPIASLKLTVALFAMSIVLILAGTFAQVDLDIWPVIGQYFRCWFAWIPFPIFFPPSFVPKMPDNPEEVTQFGRVCIQGMQSLKHLAELCGGIWFPGGKLIGVLLAANLLSAHLVRFKAQARGTRLLAGIGAIGLGCGLTWFIIAAAGNAKTFQTQPWIPYSTLWIGFQAFLGLMLLGSIYLVVTLFQDFSKGPHKPNVPFVIGLMASVSVVLTVVLGWLVYTGEAARPSDSSLRILWQLTQGGAASIALLAGCWVVFGKRAGIVVLHSGIGLMMFYELHVAMTAIEMQMHLEEGETSSFVSDIRTYELAIVDKSIAGEDRVTAIPRSMIVKGNTLDIQELPFKITIQDLMDNSNLRGLGREVNPATAGLGLEWFVEPKKAGSGTDMESKVDMAAAYVTLTDRTTNEPIGTYLTSMALAYFLDETDTIKVKVGDQVKRFELALRPKRYYKPYQFRLKDVRKEDYLGTSTPKNYASTVHIDDKDRNVNEDKTIWMNNPLRFANETFYQSSFVPETDTASEKTVLSVVANSGWMMPYVAYMLVAVGMLAHFLILLVRFLMRSDAVKQSESAARLAERLGMTVPAASPQAVGSRPIDWQSIAAAATIVIVAGAYITSKAIPPTAKDLDYNLYQFGQIPVVQDGRVKPLDSAAYSALLEISGRTYVEIGHGKDKRKIPAIQWLLDVIAVTDIAEEYEVFRVENLEVQETIGVKKREGMRYSRKEIARNEPEFRKQAKQAREVARNDRRQLSVYQRKILELSDKLATYDNLKFAFGLSLSLQKAPIEEKVQMMQNAMEFEPWLAKNGQPVFAIPPQADNSEWQTVAGAWIKNFFQSRQGKAPENPTVTAWSGMLSTYAESTYGEDKAKNKGMKRPQDFNKEVAAYLKSLDDSPPRDLSLFATRFEAFFNHFQPFTHVDRLYVVAFVIGACGWLGWTSGFNRTAFWLLCFTLFVHTLALVGRIYISGRPPVTNLYSSAVFIGWGCVVLGLVLEIVYRLGIGNLIASVAGYATLLIADGLALKGDTFTVLQAVLDTQFWLATHVTSISLGYATTYLAGLLGVVYILRGVFTPSLTPEVGRDLSRMIYGTLCFSILFSFIGTVLGGLWADDSWGRFWGWDPKENGALIIVLWNALVLHARWGGMVKERGMAVLSVAGNIFVSWSWWGVNELGAGLHTYGFTEGTVIKLGLFVLSQLVLIGIGLIPRRYWTSFRQRAVA